MTFHTRIKGTLWESVPKRKKRDKTPLTPLPKNENRTSPKREPDLWIRKSGSPKKEVRTFLNGTKNQAKAPSLSGEEREGERKEEREEEKNAREREFV